MTAPEEAPAAMPSTRPRRRVATWIAVALAVPLFGLVAVFSTRQPASQRAVSSPLLGRIAPAIEGPTVDGGRMDLDGLRGRWVVVNFFATWCVPCRKEHPDLVRFDRRHRAAGDASVVGVVFSDSAAEVRAYRRRFGGDWPMADDPQGDVATAWGVSGVPESFLVDPRGVVRTKVVGGVTFDNLERLLAQAQGRTERAGARSPG